MTLSDRKPADNGTSSFWSAHRAALLTLGLLLIFRLIYGAGLGMAEDEMYYWQWSRHLSSSYYDQGPGIAYCIRLGTLIAGATPLGIRLVGILLGIGTGWFTYLTVYRWAGRTAGLWALALTNVAPLFAAGSILATYDGPQVFCWAAALYALTCTLQEEKAAGWYAVGALVGLGLLCKLTMLLFAPGVLLFLLLSPRYRRWLATPHPWLAFILALILFAPVVLWNVHHGWMGFLHTVTLGSRRHDAKPFRWFGDFLGGQAIALGPLLFLAELYIVGRLCARVARDMTDRSEETAAIGRSLSGDAARFLIAFSAPTLLLCLIVSLKSKMEINWPAPTHLMGLACVGAWFADVFQSGRRTGRGWATTAAVLSGVIAFVAFFPALPTWFGARISEKVAEKLNQTYGWEPIMADVERERQTLAAEGKPLYLAGINYRVDSALAFYLPDHPETYGFYLDSRRDQYFVWTDPARLVGGNVLLCFDDKNDNAVDLARRYFDSVTEVSQSVVTRPGFDGKIKHWYIYACRNFHGYDPTAHVSGY